MGDVLAQLNAMRVRLLNARTDTASDSELVRMLEEFGAMAALVESLWRLTRAHPDIAISVAMPDCGVQSSDELTAPN